MAVTIEHDGNGIREVDTTDGPGSPLLTRFSESVTTVCRTKALACADSATTTIPLGGISAVQVLAIKTSGALTLKLNGESTGHVVNGVYVHQDPGGGITAATLTNASGGALTAQTLVAG